MPRRKRKLPPPRWQPRPYRPGKTITGSRVESRAIVRNVIYQREWIKCGRANCRCSREAFYFHGPYYYAYYTKEPAGSPGNGGSFVSRYLGTTFREIDPHKGAVKLPSQIQGSKQSARRKQR